MELLVGVGVEELLGDDENVAADVVEDTLLDGEWAELEVELVEGLPAEDTVLDAAVTVVHTWDGVSALNIALSIYILKLGEAGATQLKSTRKTSDELGGVYVPLRFCHSCSSVPKSSTRSWMMLVVSASSWTRYA